MKIFFFLLCCATATSAQTPSLNANAGATTISTANPANQTIVGYQLGGQAANQNVWQKIVRTTDAQDNFTDQTNQAYVELATGLNHLVNNQWVASKEEIDILPDGTAAATNGQHQAYFPGDIYSGQIELVTPDGKQLFSRPVGLSYFDGTKSVLIAELTNSIGEVKGNNQVIYPNAFTGFGADIRYTYTKAGFEQDIILREQPPTPASFGLNPDTTRLQVLTEFFNPPQPTVTATTVPTDAGDLENDNLDFGMMQMGPGKAFLLGTNSSSAMVNKQWLILDGRQILVEEVPVVSIADDLENLPLPQTASIKSNAPLNVVSARRLLPTQRMATVPNKHPIQLAQTTTSLRGLVLDYSTVNSSLTNYTFQGDTTYYISGTVNLYQTNTFEGGAVLKYTNNASVNFGYGSVLNWKAAAYHPVIFTARDDNSVGDVISGSSGSPSGYYANPALSFDFSSGVTISLSYFRIAWASQAIAVDSYGTNDFYNGQVVNCLIGIACTYDPINLQNLLFANVHTNFYMPFSTSINAQNTTFSSNDCLVEGVVGGTTITLTNCILVNVTQLTNGTISSISGDHNGFYNSPAFGTNIKTSSLYPFQSAGGGNYYLTNGCNFLSVGTTNIDPTLLASLAQKTTWPPMVYSNVTITNNLTLSPYVQRDTNALPSMGYHYDPLDYAFGGVVLNDGVTLTVNPGTAIAAFNIPPFALSSLEMEFSSGAQFICQGTATHLNRFVEYNTVQESVWNSRLGTILDTLDNSSAVNCRFTDFSVMGGDAYAVEISYYASTPVFQNCQFHGGKVYVGTSGSSFINCLFERVISTFNDGAVANTIRNNLFWNNSSMTFDLSSAGSVVQDNMFYQSAIMDSSTASYIRGYNGYYTTNGTFLHGTNATDKILTNDVGYEAGVFGNYYLPAGSPLIDAGSANANLLGLNFYTTQTNQTADAGTVDIGYHYYLTGVDSTGTNFWLAFPSLLNDFDNVIGLPSLYISGAAGATGTVSIPGLIGNGPILTVSTGVGAVNGTYVLTNASAAEQEAWGLSAYDVSYIASIYVKGTNQMVGQVAGYFGGEWYYDWYLVGYNGGSGANAFSFLYFNLADNLASANWSTNYVDYYYGITDSSLTTMCAQAPFSESFSVTTGAVTQIVAPVAAMITDDDMIETNGINITASAPVSVYGYYYSQAASAAFTACPTSLFGTNYCVLARPSYEDVDDYYPSELAIVATADNTHVTITPSATADLAGYVWTNTFTLQQGQTYQINSGDDTNDVTGTWVTSDKPIGVFAGAIDAYVPDANTESGNPLMQEQLPVEQWGTNVVAMSFAGRLGDTFRVLAAYSNTVVTVSGIVVTNSYGSYGGTNYAVVTTNLDAGSNYETILLGPAQFQSTKPIQVAQFANGARFDGSNNNEGDPCEILLAPIGQWMNNYTVYTSTNDLDEIIGDFDENFLNLIVPQSATNTTLVDGLTVASTNFVAIGMSGYYGAQLTMTNSGAHTVNSSQPIEVQVYGWGIADAYSYFGGMVK